MSLIPSRKQHEMNICIRVYINLVFNNDGGEKPFCQIKRMVQWIDIMRLQHAFCMHGIAFQFIWYNIHLVRQRVLCIIFYVCDVMIVIVYHCLFVTSIPSVSVTRTISECAVAIKWRWCAVELFVYKAHHLSTYSNIFISVEWMGKLFLIRALVGGRAKWNETMRNGNMGEFFHRKVWNCDMNINFPFISNCPMKRNSECRFNRFDCVYDITWCVIILSLNRIALSLSLLSSLLLAFSVKIADRGIVYAAAVFYGSIHHILAITGKTISTFCTVRHGAFDVFNA